MTGKNIFLSYASDSFIPARDSLCASALAVGFDEVLAKSFDDLDLNFIQKNRGILYEKRGAGYWLWKPQIILQELRKLQQGDLLVYSDAGRSSYYQFRRFPENLARLTRQNGFLLGPTIGQHGSMSQWTKRDAFVLMNMDFQEIYTLPPIQATWSFWTPSQSAFDFLEKWLDACSDPRILTDMDNTQGLPNLVDFKDHRHDQSVLSLLAYKEQALYLDYHNSWIENLLLQRSKSVLSNLYLKRIDDIEQRNIIFIIFNIVRSIYDIYWRKNEKN